MGNMIFGSSNQISPRKIFDLEKNNFLESSKTSISMSLCLRVSWKHVVRFILLGKPPKNHDFHWFFMIFQAKTIDFLSELVLNSRHAYRRGAVGVPQPRNMSGMLPVLSIPIVMAIGGPKPILSLESQKLLFFLKSVHFPQIWSPSPWPLSRVQRISEPATGI